MEKGKTANVQMLGLATTMATKVAPVPNLSIVKNKQMSACNINQY